MKIGLLIYGSLEQHSGGYLYDRMLVEALRRHGNQVEVISLPARNYAGNLLDNFDPRLRRRLQTERYDVLLQDELCHRSLFVLNRRLRPVSVPIVAIVHHLRGSEPRARFLNGFYRRIEWSYLRTVAGAIYNSQVTRTTVEGLLGIGLPGIVAYPGRDHLNGRIERGMIRERATQAGPLRLVFVGNLIPRKGLHVLLDALEQLPPDSVRLTVIGSPDFQPSYARTIHQRIERMNGRVRGSLPHSTIREHLMDAHVLVMPSAYEGFGIAYLEGMGCGLPAIATTAGGASDLVRDGENGFLIPPNDPRALSERLAQLAADRSLLARMGERALLSFESHPTWEQSSARIAEFIKDFAERWTDPVPLSPNPTAKHYKEEDR